MPRSFLGLCNFEFGIMARPLLLGLLLRVFFLNARALVATALASPIM